MRKPAAAKRNRSCRHAIHWLAFPSAANRAAPWTFVAGLASVMFAGCSTPGPLHLYSVSPTGAEIHDLAVGEHDVARDVPGFLGPEDQLTGFAYDPFADHFFLRLAPGNHLRVVDRPARKIKRELTIEGAPVDGGGDLALNSRTGHLYLLDPAAPQVTEATRLGKFLRVIPLAGQTEPHAAIAFDSGADQLLMLRRDGRTIDRYDLSGNRQSGFQLDRTVLPSLAYSADTGMTYAPLGGDVQHVGVFDGQGHLVRTISIPPGDRFIDVGPHSFLRVF